MSTKSDDVEAEIRFRPVVPAQRPRGSWPVSTFSPLGASHWQDPLKEAGARMCFTLRQPSDTSATSPVSARGAPSVCIPSLSLPFPLVHRPSSTSSTFAVSFVNFSPGHSLHPLLRLPGIPTTSKLHPWHSSLGLFGRSAHHQTAPLSLACRPSSGLIVIGLLPCHLRLGPGGPRENPPTIH